MRNNGKGGMQTSGLSGSILCGKCGKSAARAVYGDNEAAFLHYTKAGSLWHVRNYESGAWRTEKKWEGGGTDGEAD